MKTATLPFDAAIHLKSAEAQSELLADALVTGEAGYIASALATITRARGLNQSAEVTNLASEAETGGDAKLSTLIGVTKALGLKLTVARTT